MRKLTGSLLIVMLAMTIVASALPTHQATAPMSRTEMQLTQGGLSWKCWAAIAGMAIGTAGAVIATGGAGAVIVVSEFVIGQAGLVSATVGLVAGCS